MAHADPESPALILARREARFVAFAVDALVLAVLMVPFVALGGLAVLLQSAWLEVDPTLGEWLIGGGVAGVWLAIPPLYAAVGALSGGTLGARLLRLAIADADGRPVDADRAVMRALLLYPSTWVLGLGQAVALVDPLGRGLHDRLAGTVVVERERVRHE